MRRGELGWASCALCGGWEGHMVQQRRWKEGRQRELRDAERAEGMGAACDARALSPREAASPSSWVGRSPSQRSSATTCSVTLSNDLAPCAGGASARPAAQTSISSLTHHLAALGQMGSMLARRSRLSCPFCVPGIELCPPGKRFLITMVASFVATAGQLLMPGLAALCRDWQVLQALIICPFLPMLLYWS